MLRELQRCVQCRSTNRVKNSSSATWNLAVGWGGGGQVGKRIEKSSAKVNKK